MGGSKTRFRRFDFLQGQPSKMSMTTLSFRAIAWDQFMYRLRCEGRTHWWLTEAKSGVAQQAD